MAAPIVVFAYRRPEHLRRTLLSLMECEGFADSPVIVLSLIHICSMPHAGGATMPGRSSDWKPTRRRRQLTSPGHDSRSIHAAAQRSEKVARIARTRPSRPASVLPSG